MVTEYTEDLKMTVLDLFSGIGGFSLGLERAGFKTVAFCEIDNKAAQVLRKHWPTTIVFDDVHKLNKDILDLFGYEKIDVICGGFPCQDISLAGKGAGLSGERSGLWYEFLRLIKEINPRYAIIENVSALRSRGLEEVLGSLSEVGYDAEWHCIPASAVGAPHRRDRVWIIAYPVREGLERQRPIAGRIEAQLKDASNARRWPAEPNVGRMAYGVPGRVDRLKQLGNSVVCHIPEHIGWAIRHYDIFYAT